MTSPIANREDGKSARDKINALIAKTPSLASRADLVAAKDKFAVGAVVSAGGISYRYDGTSTVISDLPGWVVDDLTVIGSMHTSGGVDDYSIRLAKNRSDLTPDTANRGYYFYQDYTSSRDGEGSLFGFAANVKRSGGTRKVVPAQLNGYAMDAGGSSVWGIATEAWTGDSATAPVGDAVLVGGEFAVISQRHDNTKSVVGTDVVFKNRKDGAAEVLHGSAGTNAFNRYSKAIQISTTSRPTSGAYTGWNTGIYFSANSLDESLDGKAVGIDMSVVPSARVKAAFMPPKDVASMAWLVNGGGGILDGIQYNGASRLLEFVRNVAGASPEVRVKIDLTSAGPTGTVLASTGTTTTATAGTAGAPPTQVAGYLPLNLGGVTYKIPVYAN